MQGSLNKLLLVLWALLLFSAQMAQAVVVEDLYVAKVLTPGQSRDDLARGAEAGLLQVLIKASGDPNVGNNTLIRQSLPRASRIYYQYGFSSTDKKIFVGDGDIDGDIDGEGDGYREVDARLLTLHFDRKAVTAMLVEAGLPVWGQNRPAVLVWIAVDEGEGGGRYLLTGDEDGDIGKLIAAHAARRGLPLIFPVMDLEDAAKVSVVEVWGALIGHIEDASQRYHPDSVLTARLSGRKDGQWSANWSYKPRDRWLGLSRRSRTADVLVGEMIDRMADELASLYAHGTDENTVWLRIEEIRSVKDYANLNRYVEALSSVKNAFIVEVDGNTAFYRLQIIGFVDQLRELIELDRKMKPVDSPDGLPVGGLLEDGSSKESALVYRWTD